MGDGGGGVAERKERSLATIDRHPRVVTGLDLLSFLPPSIHPFGCPRDTGSNQLCPKLRTPSSVPLSPDHRENSLSRTPPPPLLPPPFLLLPSPRPRATPKGTNLAYHKNFATRAFVAIRLAYSYLSTNKIKQIGIEFYSSFVC